MVMVRMSRFSIWTICTVSRISSGSKWTLRMGEGGLYAVHEFEDVFVLRVDSQAQLLGLGVQLHFQRIQTDRGLRHIDQHDHDEEFPEQGLGDVHDIDAGAVMADDGDDDAV